jgi:hypothetical protein
VATSSLVAPTRGDTTSPPPNPCLTRASVRRRSSRPRRAGVGCVLQDLSDRTATTALKRLAPFVAKRPHRAARYRLSVVADWSPKRTGLMRVNGTVVSRGRTELAAQVECRRCRTSVSRVRENRMHGSRWRQQEMRAYRHGPGASRPTRPVVGPLVACGAPDLHQGQKRDAAGFTRVRRVPPVAWPVDDAVSFTHALGATTALKRKPAPSSTTRRTLSSSSANSGGNASGCSGERPEPRSGAPCPQSRGAPHHRRPRYTERGPSPFVPERTR